MQPQDSVLLPRDLPWERAYDREHRNAPLIAKLRLMLPADYPVGTVLKLPMPCSCGEHTSRFTKIRVGTSAIIKWGLGICGLAAPPGMPPTTGAAVPAAGAAPGTLSDGVQLEHAISGPLPSNSELNSSELIRSEQSNSGFKGVSKVSSGATPYYAQVWRKGKTVTLGRYATAEEAARVYAATPEGIADLAANRQSKQSSGVQLITSATNKTGFKGVYRSKGALPYCAQVCRGGETVTLGRYATAEEAARIYASTPEGKAELAARSAPQASNTPRKRPSGASNWQKRQKATGANPSTSSAASSAASAEFEVDRILSERRRPSGGVEYLVAWTAARFAPSWEPAPNLVDEDGAVCSALLAWRASRAAPQQGGPATEPLPSLGMPAGEPLPPLAMPAVLQALEGVGLGRYAAAFEEQGYDDLRYLRTMDAAERATVAESVGMKQGHASKFVKFALEPA